MLLTSDTISAFAKAMAAAQGAMQHASKDRTNPAFKSRYADLASVLDACRGPLSANGLCVLQPASTSWDNGVVFVTVDTRVIHESGEWVSESLSVVAADAKPQTVGSCITYLRRFGLSAMVGIAPDDDDGQAASGGANTMKFTDAALIAAHRVFATDFPDHVGEAAACKTLDELRKLYNELKAAKSAKEAK